VAGKYHWMGNSHRRGYAKNSKRSKKVTPQLTEIALINGATMRVLHAELCAMPACKRIA